jgi:hypothetical protein
MDRYCCYVPYWTSWPQKYWLGHINYTSNHSRSWDNMKIRYCVQTWCPSQQMAFFIVRTLLQRGPQSNSFPEIKMYKNKPRNIICQIWLGGSPVDMRYSLLTTRKLVMLEMWCSWQRVGILLSQNKLEEIGIRYAIYYGNELLVTTVISILILPQRVLPQNNGSFTAGPIICRWFTNQSHKSVVPHLATPKTYTRGRHRSLQGCPKAIRFCIIGLITLNEILASSLNMFCSARYIRCNELLSGNASYQQGFR